MVRAEWAIFEEDYWAINNVLEDLLKSSQRQQRAADRPHGPADQPSAGRDVEFDLTSFASLCAADFEANYQLAKLIGEKDFSTLYHQGARTACTWARSPRAWSWWCCSTRARPSAWCGCGSSARSRSSNGIIERLYEKLEYRNEEYDTFDEAFTEGVEAEIDNLFVD